MFRLKSGIVFRPNALRMNVAELVYPVAAEAHYKDGGGEGDRQPQPWNLEWPRTAPVLNRSGMVTSG